MGLGTGLEINPQLPPPWIAGNVAKWSLHDTDFHVYKLEGQPGT